MCSLFNEAYLKTAHSSTGSSFQAAAATPAPRYERSWQAEYAPQHRTPCQQTQQKHYSNRTAPAPAQSGPCSSRSRPLASTAGMRVTVTAAGDGLVPENLHESTAGGDETGMRVIGHVESHPLDPGYMEDSV